MKKVLLIALEYAPCRSAGVQRTLRFAEFLKEFGWQPIVLTATDNIYQRRDDTLVAPDCPTVRAKCEDASVKFAINGKYFQWMTLPDKYWPWYFDAVRQGCRLIEEHKPDVIWSTYPVLTAHLIAKKLSQKFELPWIADFRDPLQCRYDSSAQQYSWFKKWLEARVVKSASQIIFTSEKATDFYRTLYINENKDKFATIENGFYHDNLIQDEGLTVSTKRKPKFQLLYSGALYQNGREPRPLFEAVASLKRDGVINADNFILTFRASKLRMHSSILHSLNISDIVEFLPPISFFESSIEMKNASATVLIQDELFHRQIPGKVYDYISAGKPILAVTPPNSATADLVNKLPNGFQVWNKNEIMTALTHLISNCVSNQEDIQQYSRKARTEELSHCLEQLLLKTN